MSTDTGPRLGSPCFVATYLALCLILFVATALSAWADVFEPYAPDGRADLLKLLIYIASSGGLGATVYCIRALYKHYSLGDYDPRYVYWYVFRPWIGAVLGVVAYLLIAGGLLALNAGDPARARLLYVAVAFLAGFSANEFIMKVNALAKTFFGVNSASQPTPNTTGGGQGSGEGGP